MNSSVELRGRESRTKISWLANLLLTGLQTRGKRQPIIAVNSRRGRTVSKPEWGVKRLCQSCGTKYYDLKRAPITCPSCGAEADRVSPLKSRRSRSTATAPKPVPVAPVKKPQPIEAEAEGEKVADLPDADPGDADLPDANPGDADLPDADPGDDLADDSDDDVIEDTSELGGDDVSDVAASKDDDDKR